MSPDDVELSYVPAGRYTGQNGNTMVSYAA
jgi:hypothetical protein